MILQEFTYKDTRTGQQGAMGATSAEMAARLIFREKFGSLGPSIPDIRRDGFLVICGPIEVFDPEGGVWLKKPMGE
jgi:hypothetical protein